MSLLHSKGLPSILRFLLKYAFSLVPFFKHTTDYASTGAAANLLVSRNSIIISFFFGVYAFIEYAHRHNTAEQYVLL